LKNNLFTTLSKPIVSTMVGAWSRQCEIQQEIVYAA
jgi:Txe/YoeB family toxin of Txe-Axe toxin-antitoxin module